MRKNSKKNKKPVGFKARPITDKADMKLPSNTFNLAYGFKEGMNPQRDYTMRDLFYQINPKNEHPHANRYYRVGMAAGAAFIKQERQMNEEDLKAFGFIVV